MITYMLFLFLCALGLKTIILFFYLLQKLPSSMECYDNKVMKRGDCTSCGVHGLLDSSWLVTFPIRNQWVQWRGSSAAGWWSFSTGGKGGSLLEWSVGHCLWLLLLWMGSFWSTSSMPTTRLPIFRWAHFWMQCSCIISIQKNSMGGD